MQLINWVNKQTSIESFTDQQQPFVILFLLGNKKVRVKKGETRVRKGRGKIAFLIERLRFFNVLGIIELLTLELTAAIRLALDVLIPFLAVFDLVNQIIFLFFALPCD